MCDPPALQREAPKHRSTAHGAGPQAQQHGARLGSEQPPRGDGGQVSTIDGLILLVGCFIHVIYTY